MSLIALASVVVILLIVNLLTNRWAKRHYLVICLVSTALLLGIARLDDISWYSLGLGASTWKQGLIWAAAVFGAVVLFYAIASSIPLTRKGFGDKRTAEHGWPSLVYHSAVRIPFGTALLEETAFRGVLLAVVAQSWGMITAIVVSSVLFGFWHVLPSLEFHENSDIGGMVGSSRKAQASSVVLTVLGTGAAGVGFCLLRNFTDSLFPPIMLHASLNGIGLAVSWAFARKLRDL